jgi:hypothetical protein
VDDSSRGIRLRRSALIRNRKYSILMLVMQQNTLQET